MRIPRAPMTAGLWALAFHRDGASGQRTGDRSDSSPRETPGRQRLAGGRPQL